MNALRQLNAEPRGSDCGHGVKVAIIDTGLDMNVLQNYPRNLEQFDLDRPRKTTTPQDPIGHGSVVAAIINRISPGAELFPVKVMEATGTVWSVLCGLFLAEARFQPDIYNLSLQLKCDIARCAYCKRGPGILPAHLELLFSSFLPTGVSNRVAPLVVAAAGNDARQLLMPASFPDVLAVGSFDVTAYRTPDYSTYESVPAGRFILAPGGLNSDEECFAMRPPESCTRLGTRFYGTSFSAAYVSGIAARYLCATR
jgi:subtilisin family serine protease